MGYLLRNNRFRDGVIGSLGLGRSISTYTYAGDGERKTINYADQACRINNYGTSVTQCHQVSDGETGQEVLAAHIGEPVRNFGIGGYSVYLAYLRMLREEKKTPAPYIIFNIYIDDHIRSINPWKLIRYSKDVAYFGATLPHITVDLATGECTEKPNPCPTVESLYNLCDLDWLIETFGNSLTAGWSLITFSSSAG